jgi:hypothetical protein
LARVASSIESNVIRIAVWPQSIQRPGCQSRIWPSLTSALRRFARLSRPNILLAIGNVTVCSADMALCLFVAVAQSLRAWDCRCDIPGYRAGMLSTCTISCRCVRSRGEQIEPTIPRKEHCERSTAVASAKPNHKRLAHAALGSENTYSPRRTRRGPNVQRGKTRSRMGRRSVQN